MRPCYELCFTVPISRLVRAEEVRDVICAHDFTSKHCPECGTPANGKHRKRLVDVPIVECLFIGSERFEEWVFRVRGHVGTMGKTSSHAVLDATRTDDTVLVKIGREVTAKWSVPELLKDVDALIADFPGLGLKRDDVWVLPAISKG